MTRHPCGDSEGGFEAGNSCAGSGSGSATATKKPATKKPAPPQRPHLTAQERNDLLVNYAAANDPLQPPKRSGTAAGHARFEQQQAAIAQAKGNRALKNRKKPKVNFGGSMDEKATDK